MQRYDARGIAGNHDLACAGKLSFESFNPDATAAVLWTTDQLSEDDVTYLSGLPTRVEMAVPVAFFRDLTQSVVVAAPRYLHGAA